MSPDLSFPESWKTPPIRLAEQDSEPEEIDTEAEIERLAKLGNSITGRLQP